MSTLLITFIIFLASSSPMASPSEDCGPDEAYDLCGTYCPPTCQLPSPPSCPEVCISGCFCQEGYIRDYLNGTCIPTDECQNSCRDNEEYKICGLTCPPTCVSPIPTCTNNCCSKGCFCTEGYILEDVTQTCVRENECPSQ